MKNYSNKKADFEGKNDAKVRKKACK